MFAARMPRLLMARKDTPLAVRDGRKLAIAMLRQAREVGTNAAIIKAERLNAAPQNNFVLGYIWTVREANDPKFEAEFCAVLSDVLARRVEGQEPSIEFYEDIADAR